MIAVRRILPAVFVALAMIGLLRLRFDPDILNLLPSDSAVARGLAEYQDKFLQAGELIVVVRSHSSEATLQAVHMATAELRKQSNIVESVFWQPPANESLRDAAQFLAYLWLNSPTSNVFELRHFLSPEKLSATLEQSRDRIATSFNPTDLFLLPRDPLNLSAIASGSNEAFETPERFFASEDGRTRLIFTYAAAPLLNYEQCRMWVREIRGIIRNALRGTNFESVDILLTGRPVFVDEISSGMRSDMSTAVPGTLFLIGLLFYFAHREWISLFLLLATLFVVMVWTALAGAGILGQLNVISLGFASILLGLAEDFGIVLHQELKSHPGATAEEVRKVAGPGIFWSALTTSLAFALLNLSALPGLRNLGTLVALGIVIGAWAMLFVFLPLIVRFRKSSGYASRSETTVSTRTRPLRFAMPITAAAIVLVFAGIAMRPPLFDPSPNVLRPRQSEASEALQIVQEVLGTSGDPFWLLVRGSSEQKVRERLERLEEHLKLNGEEIGISFVTLPTAIWPDMPSQTANITALRELALGRDEVFDTILASGFTPEALELADTVFAEWQSFASGSANWPRGRVADWVLPKFVHRPAEPNSGFIALGLLNPTARFTPGNVVPDDLKDKVILSGWSLLGKSVLRQVMREVPMISALVALAVIFALWLTFRKLAPVLLSLAVLAFGGSVLVALMGSLGWRWNLLNLTALPLLLGMGIDYSIHMQKALHRFNGDSTKAFQSVGRALLLAGSTTIIGFGFLGMSSNAGMASLGRVCALGLAILLLTSVFLLPGWSKLITSPQTRT